MLWNTLQLTVILLNNLMHLIKLEFVFVILIDNWVKHSIIHSFRVKPNSSQHLCPMFTWIPFQSIRLWNWQKSTKADDWGSKPVRAFTLSMSRQIANTSESEEPLTTNLLHSFDKLAERSDIIEKLRECNAFRDIGCPVVVSDSHRVAIEWTWVAIPLRASNVLFWYFCFLSFIFALNFL